MGSVFLNQLRSLASGVLFLALLLLPACSDKSSMTGPSGTGSVSGTVVLGSASAAGLTKEAMPIGLAGVRVKAAGMSQSTMTDGSGQFTFTGVPAGNPELDFDRSDIHARGNHAVTAGAMMHVTVAIVGSRAEIAEGDDQGNEIEGLVSAVDTAGGTLTVLDQRLGAVVVHVDSSTIIRTEDDTPITLAQIQIGNHVHVKALKQANGTLLATEVFLQSDKVGGNREVEGSVTMVDQGKKSFVVQTESGTVTVTTDGSTTFRREGGNGTFSDVVAGADVEVVGTLQSDGTVLAKKVDIED